MNVSTIAIVVLFIQLALVCWFDFKLLIIPNALNFSLMITGLVAHAKLADTNLANDLLKVVLVYAFFWLVAAGYQSLRGRVGLGGGDIKFLAAASAWIDLQALPWLILVASLSGLATVLVSGWSAGKLQAVQKIPFGPHLALGLLVVWIAINWLGLE